MKMVKFYCIIVVFGSLTLTNAQNVIPEAVNAYFNSDIVKEFGDQWNVYKKAYEDALEKTLLRTYGRKKLNEFDRKPVYRNQPYPSLYVTDNVVSVLLRGMKIRDLPTLTSAKVEFSLDKNRLKLECGLSKMFIDSDYVLFRNKSSILYNDAGATQDLYKNSPFTLQEVQPFGNVTIMIDNCHITGSILTTLLGFSVNTGYSTLRLIDCDFAIEIYNDYVKGPPVIAPYFSKSQTQVLKSYLGRAVRDEMLEIIQGTLFSQINTTAIFGLENLMKYRHHQAKILRTTNEYMSQVMRNMNRETLTCKKPVLDFEDFKLTWKDQNFDHEYDTTLDMKSISIDGLETAFSANMGGPYVTSTPRIGEYIKFHMLYVHGQLTVNNGVSYIELDFGLEIKNVVVAFNEIFEGETAPIGRHFTTEYSSMDYMIKPLSLNEFDRETCKALVRSYFMNILPEKLASFVRLHYQQAASEKLSSINGDGLELNTKNPIEYDDNNAPNNVEDNEVNEDKEVEPNTNDEENAEGDDESLALPPNQPAESYEQNSNDQLSFRPIS